ncbi:MAG TPA: nucleotidyltransferase family protein [Longilinea sp.]|nr:nucleotidyltransferase family protein [Longilinea sp.]
MNDIAAVILAAGRSTRMGSSKMLLPWKDKTVLDSVIDLAESAGLNPIVVVTGAFHDDIHLLLSKYFKRIEEIHNPSYAQLEMFHSIKLGVESLVQRCGAAIIFLGDQPQIETELIDDLISRFNEKKSRVIIPSFQMHRGHPIVIHQDLFPEILATPDDKNLKSFLNLHSSEIDYVVVNTSSVLQDMDSPEDYHRLKNNQKE